MPSVKLVFTTPCEVCAGSCLWRLPSSQSPFSGRIGLSENARAEINAQHRRQDSALNEARVTIPGIFTAALRSPRRHKGLQLDFPSALVHSAGRALLLLHAQVLVRLPFEGAGGVSGRFRDPDAGADCREGSGSVDVFTHPACGTFAE
jgi:hypothetical protein